MDRKEKEHKKIGRQIFSVYMFHAVKCVTVKRADLMRTG